MTTTVPDLTQFIRDSGVLGYYGVYLVELGQEGEWLVAPGHVEPRRMIAACNAYARGTGWTTLADLGTLPDVLGRIRHRMAAVVQPCPGVVHDEDCDDCRGAQWGLRWGDDHPGRDTAITVLDWT
jgi:hypothetical protein